MPADLKNSKAQDLKFIIRTDQDIAHWTKALGCTKQELEDAISSVVDPVTEVEEQLKN
jgi:hypothetical protein